MRVRFCVFLEIYLIWVFFFEWDNVRRFHNFAVPSIEAIEQSVATGAKTCALCFAVHPFVRNMAKCPNLPLLRGPKERRTVIQAVNRAFYKKKQREEKWQREKARVPHGAFPLRPPRPGFQGRLLRQQAAEGRDLLRRAGSGEALNPPQTLSALPLWFRFCPLLLPLFLCSLVF